jgi:hypothetical protein
MRFLSKFLEHNRAGVAWARRAERARFHEVQILRRGRVSWKGGQGLATPP